MVGVCYFSISLAFQHIGRPLPSKQKMLKTDTKLSVWQRLAVVKVRLSFSRSWTGSFVEYWDFLFFM